MGGCNKQKRYNKIIEGYKDKYNKANTDKDREYYMKRIEKYNNKLSTVIEGADGTSSKSPNIGVIVGVVPAMVLVVIVIWRITKKYEKDPKNAPIDGSSGAVKKTYVEAFVAPPSASGGSSGSV